MCLVPFDFVVAAENAHRLFLVSFLASSAVDYYLYVFYICACMVLIFYADTYSASWPISPFGLQPTFPKGGALRPSTISQLCLVCELNTLRFIARFARAELCRTTE